MIRPVTPTIKKDKETIRSLKKKYKQCRIKIRVSHHCVGEVSVPAVDINRYLAAEQQIASNPGAPVSKMLRFPGLSGWETVGQQPVSG